MGSTSQSQKKSLLSLVAANLSNLTIPPSSSSTNDLDFDFSHVFGPNPSPSQSSPHVIHNRSHSFVGPSPRFPISSNSLFSLTELSSHSDDDDSEPLIEAAEKEKAKIGPGDFLILRVVGQGAFGKVFLVRKKGDCFMDGDGDGVYAMKVMRKDTIIKKNHVDYMKAERDILTKLIHPFIVQLRYSFQVLFLFFPLSLATQGQSSKKKHYFI